MQEFLERIGLSAINIITNSNNNNDEISKQNIKLLKNQKFRIPRNLSQNTIDNKIYPAESSLSLSENFMPPLAPTKFNHLKSDEQHQSLRKLVFKFI